MATLVEDFIDVSTAAQMEQQLQPGGYEIRFYVTEPLDQSELMNIRDNLIDSGAKVKSVGQKKSDGLYYVSVKYVRPASPPGTIAALPIAIIPLIAFLGIGTLVGIGIFKIEEISQNIAKILLITFGGTIIIAALARKPAMQYVEKRYG